MESAEVRRQAATLRITAHNAGWPSQFRVAVNVFWSGLCEFWRLAQFSQTP
jgi:hypothetical protein